MEIVENKIPKKEFTYQYILQALGERAFGIAILFFSLPSLLPFSAIPGVAVVFSLPIIIFSLGMVLGRESIWLPETLRNKTISHSTISKIISAVLPYVVKLEYFSKPRWTLMTYRATEVINGLTILCLALLLMLPIPFSNFIFGGMLAIFSIGIIEKDGLLISIGYFCFILSIFFIYVVALNAIDAFLFIKNYV
jgi:hypothetical protein